MLPPTPAVIPRLSNGSPDDDQPDGGDPHGGTLAGGDGGDSEGCAAPTVATTPAGHPTAPPDPLYAGISTRMMSHMSSLLHMNKRLAKEVQF